MTTATWSSAFSAAPRKRDGLFYVYELCTPEGKPFYVGKGRAWRWCDHERDAKNGCSLPVHRKIRKLLRLGQAVTARVVVQTADNAVALAKESELIALYGKRCLTNLTNGGEGQAGRIPWNKGISTSPGTRRKISVALKGQRPPHVWKCWTAEARAKHSASLKGRTMPLRTRRKISATLRRKGIRPPYVGGHLPAEVKQRISESVRLAWARKRA